MEKKTGNGATYARRRHDQVKLADRVDWFDCSCGQRIMLASGAHEDDVVICPNCLVRWQCIAEAPK